MTIQLAFGTCQCGCGEPTPLATRTHKARGLVKGQPTRYLPGHQTRYHELPTVPTDCGYSTLCLIWQASINSNGYPIRGTAANGSYLVHRRVIEDSTGEPMRPGEEVHHLCGQRRCVNRDHLEVMGGSEHRSHHAHLRRVARGVES